MRKFFKFIFFILLAPLTNIFLAILRVFSEHKFKRLLIKVFRTDDISDIIKQEGDRQYKRAEKYYEEKLSDELRQQENIHKIEMGRVIQDNDNLIKEISDLKKYVKLVNQKELAVTRLADVLMFYNSKASKIVNTVRDSFTLESSELSKMKSELEQHIVKTKQQKTHRYVGDIDLDYTHPTELFKESE